MAERNHRRERKCKLCGDCVFGKATVLKEHGRECKKQHEAAAATAIMQKLQAEMLADPSVRMADEKVLNAEGD